jgi:hypothetical protein
MRKLIIFGTGIFLLVLAAWGLYKVTRSHRNVAGEQAVARFSAPDLYREFLNSENAANKKWVGRVIEISGTISSVQEAGNYFSVNLRATADGGVDCSILKKDLGPEKKLNAGDSVTIKGKCTGFLMDVNMVDCVIVP